jgi:hypothetical protein
MKRLVLILAWIARALVIGVILASIGVFVVACELAATLH